MDEREIRANVGEALAPVLGEPIVYNVEDGTVTLQGVVATEDERQLAQRLVEEVPGVKHVVNELRVEFLELWEDVPHSLAVDVTDLDEFPEAGTEDPLRAVEEAEPYTPPVDPVVRPVPREEGDIEIVGGFAPSALDVPFGTPDEPSPPEADALICEEVERLLHLDASTAYLYVTAQCHSGVVTLRGKVPTLEDAESAQWLASQVPGVVAVRDALEVEAL
jgi:hypothetical protein